MDTSVITSADFSSIITELQTQISVSTITEILVFVVGACAGLVFLWWGVRKVIGAIMSAFRKGKLSI